MTKMVRVALVAIVSAVALTVTGSALAAFSPKLTVSGATRAGAGGGVTIDVRVNQTDDPTAVVTIYVPNGYQLNSPAAGTRLGGVTAHAQAADLGGAVLPLTGDLLAVAPSQFAAQQAACGIVTAAATWDLHLTAAGQTLDVPMFVVATAGAEQTIGQFKIVVCLPPPDVPPGTPGRATFGAKLLDATFTSNAFTNPPSTGEYRWRSIWTPYTPNTGRANPAGTVEAQSLVRIPTQLTLSAKRTKATIKVRGKKRVVTRVKITGALTEGGQAIPNTKIALRAGSARKVVTTNANGGFVWNFTTTKTTTVTASGGVPARDLGSAACTKTFTAPCVDATVGATTVSATVRVTAYRR